MDEAIVCFIQLLTFHGMVAVSLQTGINKILSGMFSLLQGPAWPQTIQASIAHIVVK